MKKSFYILYNFFYKSVIAILFNLSVNITLYYITKPFYNEKTNDKYQIDVDAIDEIIFIN